MSEQNKALVKRIYTEVNDAQQYQLLEQLCHPEVTVHDPIAGDQRGIEAFRGLFAFFRAAFGKQHTELGQFVAEGDYVALLHTHHATHTGPFMGLAATHKEVVVPGIELFRFQGGKIAEFWRFDADLSLMMQLGAMPQPA